MGNRQHRSGTKGVTIHSGHGGYRQYEHSVQKFEHTIEYGPATSDPPVKRSTSSPFE
jgi:hypothetical protein